MIVASALGAALLSSACRDSREQPQPPQEVPAQSAPGVASEPTAVEPADPAAAEPATSGEAADRTPAAASEAAAPLTRSADEAAPQPRPAAEQQLRGRIAVTGSQPMTFVMLQVEGAPSLRLVGELEAELRRLSGAVVTVTGRATDAGTPGRAIEVASYDAVEIDGQPAFVGTLEADGDEHRLVAEETLHLEGVPAQLAERSGARIWVVGPREGDLVRVQSYGLIRP